MNRDEFRERFERHWHDRHCHPHMTHWRWRGRRPPRQHFFLRVVVLFIIASVLLEAIFGSDTTLGFTNITHHLGWTCVVLIAVAIILGRMFKPLRRLMRGVQEISDGNLDFQFPLQGHGEFDYLAEQFNDMAGNIREMIRSKDQLLLDVSHELRSPLTRMKVALEMAPKGQWKRSMEQDIREMETMLGRYWNRSG